MQPLLTPQQLFGEFGSSADVLAHAPFLERARLEREREQDGYARLALAAYVVARLVNRLLVKPETQEAEEGFIWQLDAVRRHLQDLPGDSPEAAHLSGITDSVPRSGPPPSALRLSLTAYAYFLEHEGRLEEGLEVLALAARTHGPAMPPVEFATIALFAGRLNRLLARWEVATSCYRGAEQAGRLLGDHVVALRGQLGCGAVLRGQGNLPAARATAEAALAAATELHLDDVQTIAYGDLGSVYTLQGMRVEALHANYRAFRLAPDPLQRMRALGDVAIGLAEIGCLDGARVGFEILVGSDTSVLLRTNALIELMNLESATRNRVAFERRRAEAESLRGRMPPSMVVDYYYKTAVGLARFGQLGRARQALRAAIEVAEVNRLNTWYFQIERVLENLSECPDHQPEPADGLSFSQEPAVQEVESGLQEYAVLASVEASVIAALGFERRHRLF